jgi:hypothetical protein
MKRMPGRKLILLAIAAGLILRAPSLMACAACYGANTDSPLASGMNWGIMSLLVVVVVVLSGIASFGIFVAKRSAALAAAAAAEKASKPGQKI